MRALERRDRLRGGRVGILTGKEPHGATSSKVPELRPQHRARAFPLYELRQRPADRPRRTTPALSVPALRDYSRAPDRQAPYNRGLDHSNSRHYLLRCVWPLGSALHQGTAGMHYLRGYCILGAGLILSIPFNLRNVLGKAAFECEDQRIKLRQEKSRVFG